MLRTPSRLPPFPPFEKSVDEFFTLIEAEGLHMRQAAIHRIQEIGFELCALYANLSADAASPPATNAWT